MLHNSIPIKKNISLKPYNTFGIEVFASLFIEVSTIEMLVDVLKSYRDYPKLILGGGSNILFTKDYEGLVIKLAIKGKTISVVDEQNIIVKAMAGEVWHEFVVWTLENKMYGLENLSLIPGCVGAAPMQNIGAYGVEIKDFFYELEALNLETFQIEKFELDSCNFGYRESIFKHQYKRKYIILSVSFKLSRNFHINIEYGAISEELVKMGVDNPTPKDVSNAVISIRQSKLPNPSILGNSGSFFKNPIIDKTHFQNLQTKYPNMPFYNVNENYKIPAGWLIEQCGWKGKKIGETGSFSEQALVLVNYGNAKGSEVLELSKEIMNSILEKFNIEITPEVNIY